MRPFNAYFFQSIKNTQMNISIYNYDRIVYRDENNYYIGRLVYGIDTEQKTICYLDKIVWEVTPVNTLDIEEWVEHNHINKK